MWQACAEGRQPEKAWEYFNQMKESGLEPHARTYTTLMNAFVGAGLYGRVAETLEQMEAAGVPPDAHALTVAIKACGNQGNWEKALGYVENIMTLETELEPISFNLAMKVR